jgi:hypothetical protein
VGSELTIHNRGIQIGYLAPGIVMLFVIALVAWRLYLGSEFQVADDLSTGVFLSLWTIGAILTAVGIHRSRPTVVVLGEHRVEQRFVGKEERVLALGPDVHIEVDYRSRIGRPVERRLGSIHVFGPGGGSILISRLDGWTEQDLRDLWWGLYAMDGRHRFQYDTPVELAKAAAGVGATPPPRSVPPEPPEEP